MIDQIERITLLNGLNSRYFSEDKLEKRNRKRWKWEEKKSPQDNAQTKGNLVSRQG